MPTITYPLAKPPKAIPIADLKEIGAPIVPALGRVFRDFARTITKKDEFCSGEMLMERKLADNGDVPIAPCAMGHLAIQLHDVDFLVKKLHFSVDKISLESDGTKYYSFRDIDDNEVLDSLVAYFKKLPQELKSQLHPKYDHDGDEDERTDDEYFHEFAESLSDLITSLNDNYVPKNMEWEDDLGLEEYAVPNKSNAPSSSRAQYVKECFKLTSQAIQAECSKNKGRTLKSRKGRSNIKVGLQ